MKKIKEFSREYLIVLKRANKFLFKNGAKGLIPFLIISTIVTSQFWVVETYLWGLLTDVAVGSKKAFDGDIITQITAIVVVYLLADVLKHFISLINGNSRNRFDYHLRNNINLVFRSKLIELSLKDLEDPRVKDAHDNAKENLMSVMNILDKQWTFVMAIITLVITVSVLSFFNWWFGIAMLFIVIPRAIVNQKANMRKYKYENRNRHISRYSFELGKHIGTEDSKSHVTEDWFLKKYESISGKFRRANYLYSKKRNKINFLFNIFDITLIMSIVYVLFVNVSNGSLSVGSIVVAMASFTRLRFAVSEIADIVTNSSVDLKKASDFFYFLDKKSSIVRPQNPTHIKNDVLPEIEFENVSFRYYEDSPVVLENISLKIKPGEHIGIVGSNSAGKSTFVKLLLGLYDPTSGRIKVNGVDMKDIDRDLYRSMFGVLFQENPLFKAKLHSAVSVGRDLKINEMQKVEKSLEMVGIDILNKKIFPDGIETWITRDYNDSVKLSGGQKQKVGLARIHFKDPKVIILDEPTASLDPIAEAEIFEDYSSTAKGRTAIMISHRFSSLSFAKRILVFDNGRMLAEGTHNELMKISTLYRDMYSKQLSLVNRNSEKLIPQENYSIH